MTLEPTTAKGTPRCQHVIASGKQCSSGVWGRATDGKCYAHSRDAAKLRQRDGEAGRAQAMLNRGVKTSRRRVPPEQRKPEDYTRTAEGRDARARQLGPRSLGSAAGRSGPGALEETAQVDFAGLGDSGADPRAWLLQVGITAIEEIGSGKLDTGRANAVFKGLDSVSRLLEQAERAGTEVEDGTIRESLASIARNLKEPKK